MASEPEPVQKTTREEMRPRRLDDVDRRNEVRAVEDHKGRCTGPEEASLGPGAPPAV